MKLLLITSLPPPSGGIATWSLQYIEYWKQKFHADSREKSVKVDVVNNAVIGKRKTDFHASKNILDEMKRTALVIRSIRETVKRENPDVVHLNSSCSHLGIMRDYLSVRAVGHKIPVCLHCRCTIQDQLGTGRIGNAFFRWTARRAAAVLVLNNISNEFVKAFCQRPVYKVANFIDEELLLGTKKPVRERIEKVVFVGHVERKKGFYEIMKAAQQLPGVNFRIVGAVNDECASYPCPGNVTLVGDVPRDVVIQELDDADVFLFPTYTEGFANALIEAMSRGLPVITTGVGANADMIEDKGGIITPVGDSESIVETLRRIDDQALREQMSAWNIEKVRRCYLIEPVMQHLISIYREVSA